MSEIRQLILNFENAVALYDSQIPYATEACRAKLVMHRTWSLNIIADLRGQLAHAPRP